MSLRLPSRLGKSPLVESIFELRFSGSPAISSILSGLLYTKLRCTGIDKLPPADVPDFVRSVDPGLKYAALSRLTNDGFFISVGDNVLTVSTHYPYPGWDTFKRKIGEVLGVVVELDLIRSAERYSLKYIDIFEDDLFSVTGRGLNVDLSFGGKNFDAPATHIRTELKRDGGVHIVQVIGKALGTMPDGVTKQGLLLDIDSIHLLNLVNLQDLIVEFDKQIDILHQEIKSLFFSLLTPEGLQSLEPEYE